ncbi:MAG: TlyA family RNA methyltransferase [Actinomycetes bacterium]
MTRRRLDAELVRRGLARSRDDAQDLIASGHVRIAGTTATKAATQVEDAAAIEVGRQVAGYVSRGAHKLLGALAVFAPSGLAIDGRIALDAGASTGGFTQVLLEGGVSKVFAVDVGYGQLAWVLRTDPRVVVIERMNVRELQPTDLSDVPDLVVGDLSFISLALVLPALTRVASAGADFVLMVKPQFEVGREQVGTGGVVREPNLRAGAVTKIATAAAELGLGVRGVTASPLPGPAGNVEYFLWLTRSAPPLDPADIERAVLEGP